MAPTMIVVVFERKPRRDCTSSDLFAQALSSDGSVISSSIAAIPTLGIPYCVRHDTASTLRGSPDPRVHSPRGGRPH